MLKIFKPCDFHVHLREGPLSHFVLRENNKHFQKILVMPNLKKPLTNSNLLLNYREEILKKNVSSEILFTIYLNNNCSLKDLNFMHKNNIFFSAKLYPLNATTNSAYGVSDIKKMSKYFAFLEDNNIPLCIHGEHVHDNDDPYDREKKFLDKELSWIIKKFKSLKITLEHITTKDSVSFVKSNKNISATITTHHLLENTFTFLGSELKPELYCKPIIKGSSHQEALQKVALSGNPKFFFGSDSAPHLKSRKFAPSCCAGIYSTKYSISNIIEFFWINKKILNIDKFLTQNGCKHYGLNYDKKTYKYKRIKNFKFQKYSKFNNDYLINYNFFKNLWVKT
tara:strand:+ start:74 stop:1087 length:1014 start_codon:yes stop_codon:yes gene_type:complete